MMKEKGMFHGKHFILNIDNQLEEEGWGIKGRSGRKEVTNNVSRGTISFKLTLTTPKPAFSKMKKNLNWTNDLPVFLR